MPISDYNETLRQWQSTPLSVDAIETLPDDELDDWLWIRLCDVVGAPSASAVGALPESQRAYYATRMFEWDVMNGGLHEYFFNNPDPDLLDLVLDGYRILGLHEQTAVLREDIAPMAEREAAWRESLRDGTIETFMESYVESSLPEFDDRIDEHDSERLRFVRRRPTDFAF